MTAFRRADRIQALELSEIVRITEKAAALRRDGRDVVSLSTGEPDFPTPDHVIAAAHAAALAGQTRYTATAGTPELRAVVAGLHGAQPAEVVISTGAKQVLAQAMLATLNPGDEVIIPTPYWTTYSDIVAMAGGRGVIVPCPMAEGFKLRPEALEAALTPRTRWVMLNAPSNPSGAVYSPSEIADLAEVLRRHPQVWLLADEIYAHLSFVPFVSFAEAAPDLRDRMLIVNGVSKAFSMTGWRIGWGVGPVALISAMVAVQGQITSGACSVAQAAALAALTGPQDLLARRLAVLKARRDRVVGLLNAIDGIDCPVPEGAFYVFPSCAGVAGGDDTALCHDLLERAGVAVVPGRAFGLPGHFRLSFAYSEAALETGIARMAAALASPG